MPEHLLPQVPLEQPRLGASVVQPPYKDIGLSDISFITSDIIHISYHLIPNNIVLPSYNWHSIIILNRAIFIYYTLMYQQNCT